MHKKNESYRKALCCGTESVLLLDRPANSRGTHENDLLVIRPLHDGFSEVLGYRTYNFADKLSGYKGQLAPSLAKWAKRVQTQIKLQAFYSFPHPSVSNFFVSS